MERGFTLIEFLVVIMVIAILSAVLFMGRGAEEKRLALQVTAFKLSQDFREAQEMAMGAGETDCGGGNYTYSFGLHFYLQDYPNSYILFADCKDKDNRDFDKNGDKVLREVFLNKDIIICALSENKLNVVFSPPEPVSYINKKDTSTEAVVTLCLKSNPGRQMQVKVNTVGKIEVQ